MADISDFSTNQQNIMKEVVENDRGFHTSFMIAETPFYGMLEELEDGGYTVNQNVECSLSSGGSDYTIQLHYSKEQTCWFYLLTYLSEEIRGIVHYNTVLNAKGELSFVILNDNTESEDISMSLPYSNVFVMRK